MRKSFLLPIAFLCTIIVLVSFNKKQPVETSKERIKKFSLACIPYYESETTPTTLFVSNPDDQILVRKDITTLTPDELRDFRNAIDRMKKDTISFFYDNPKKKKIKKIMSIWDFQAAIHGEDSTKPKTNKDFRKCVHGTKFFLAWHRMYIYFFERILHSYMPKGSNLGLPYWDYQTCSKIPDALRLSKIKNTTRDNPLYDDTRDETLSSGGYLPGYNTTKNTFKYSKIYKAIEAAFDSTEFYSFQSKLEYPHGQIHIAVRGNLSHRQTAALDPLFWLNHGNVDRIWEKWLAQYGGRCNPSSTTGNAWWNKTFYFYNENKIRVAIKGSQIVDIADSLHYQYDNVISITRTPTNCNPLNLNAYKTPTHLQKKYTVNNAKIDNNLDNEYEFANLANSDNLNGSFGFMPSTSTTNAWPSFFKNEYYLEFENIKVTTMPAGIIEIYIADKRDTSFKPSDKNFLGLFDLFTALSIAGIGSDHNHDMEEGQDDVFRININDAIRRVFTNAIGSLVTSGIKVPKISNLKNTFEDVKNMRIHFLISGNVLNGTEVKKNVNITIGKLSLAAYNTD
jgi:hypothetical protein